MKEGKIFTQVLRYFLRFFLGKNVFSHPPQLRVHHFAQLSLTFSTISSSKMFHHFFLTFFRCYSTRFLLNLLEKKNVSSHSLQLRVHLNGLPRKKRVFSHALQFHVLAFFSIVFTALTTTSSFFCFTTFFL